MELNCSSCGAKHRTEDHQGIPTSLEAGDEGIQATPDLITESPVTQRFEAQALPGISGMTAPDDLPHGMIYDPFELPTIEPGVGDMLGIPGVGTDAEPQAEVEALGAPTNEPTPEAAPPSPPVPRQTVVEAAQHLIDSTQLGSMGQYLGPSYELTIETASAELKQELLTHLEVLIEERPWLETELRKRNLDANSFVGDAPVYDCPEILAVEVYLKVFELGGVCRYKLIKDSL
jgi:hypothetical protein